MQGTDPSSLPLRDIHLPDAVSWWPLAPGWWALIILLGIVLLLTMYLIRRYRNHKISAFFLAKQELERIKTDFNINQNKSNLVKELSELIRRLSISILPRQESAGLTGVEWLRFLDQYSDKNEFENGIGRVLIEAPYQADPEFNSDKLIQLISMWIETVGKRKRVKK
ncbi:MAG: hypothetical protein DHS20C09_12740 [marine bacterium B5-7]|nr:MAG: hypothetical protein DHS20C09_12740 [marine bacterium B5-7]